MLLDANNRPISDSHIKIISHRGFTEIAPENTLPAYKLSKQKGFKYVECDVAFTSDGYAVLLHDTTINRTSNGTGNISSLTFAQVRALDFGSWKSSKYAGEKIPTLEEFIILCKKLGLYPYIEIKAHLTATTAKQLVDIVRRYGMLKHSTWTSDSQNDLALIQAEYEGARLGLCIHSVSTNYITWATNTRTDKSEIFLYPRYTVVTSDFVNSCAAADVPIEVWTPNTEAELKALDPYISGAISDSLRADAPLYFEYT